MPKKEIDYSNTMMYKIVCKDVNITDLYVGSTTNFKQRKAKHKQNCINPNSKKHNYNVYKFIRNNGNWDNWTMILIENYNCNNQLEVLKQERYWIEQLNATLNKVLPTRSAKERYLSNKEIHKEYRKKQYLENYEKEKVQMKEYRELNKEKLNKLYKIYYENNKMQLTLKNKEYTEKNKEKLKEKRSQVINCNCGLNYQQSNKARHFKSQKHINYMNQQEKQNE